MLPLKPESILLMSTRADGREHYPPKVRKAGLLSPDKVLVDVDANG